MNLYRSAIEVLSLRLILVVACLVPFYQGYLAEIPLGVRHGLRAEALDRLGVRIESQAEYEEPYGTW